MQRYIRINNFISNIPHWLLYLRQNSYNCMLLSRHILCERFYQHQCLVARILLLLYWQYYCFSFESICFKKTMQQFGREINTRLLCVCWKCRNSLRKCMQLILRYVISRSLKRFRFSSLCLSLSHSLSSMSHTQTHNAVKKCVYLLYVSRRDRFF